MRSLIINRKLPWLCSSYDGITKNLKLVESPMNIKTIQLKKFSDCNWTRTHNHLVRKRKLNHLAKLASLAKWLSVCLQNK